VVFFDGFLPLGIGGVDCVLGGLLCAVHTLTINQRCITVKTFSQKMTRRTLLLAQCEQPRCPVDDARLNAFGAAYNEYVEKLARGQLDIKQWDRVVREWERLR